MYLAHGTWFLTPISNISFSFLFQILLMTIQPTDVILLGCNSGQVGLPSYKYYTEEEVKSMIDQLELGYCVDMHRVSE